MTLPERRSSGTGGHPLAFREAGVGEPVVLVHGNLASGLWFLEQLRAPPRGCHAIAPDLAGYGGSPPMAGPVSLEAHADRLAELVDALELPPFVLVGHSLGGWVAHAFATRRPRRVRGLVLVAASPPGRFVTPEERYPLLERIPGQRELIGASLAPLFACAAPPFFDELVEEALAVDRPTFLGGARALATYRPPVADAAALIPTLLVAGSQDPLISLAAIEEAAAAYRNARLEVVTGAGHAPQLERPDSFNGLLQEFIDGLPADGEGVP